MEGNTPLERDDDVVVVVSIIYNALPWRYLDVLIALRLVMSLNECGASSARNMSKKTCSVVDDDDGLLVDDANDGRGLNLNRGRIIVSSGGLLGRAKQELSMDWLCRRTARWSLSCDCCSSCGYTVKSLTPPEVMAPQQTIRSNAEPISLKKSHHQKSSCDGEDDDDMPSVSTIGGVVVVGTTLRSIRGAFSGWTIQRTLFSGSSNREVEEITNWSEGVINVIKQFRHPQKWPTMSEVHCLLAGWWCLRRQGGGQMIRRKKTRTIIEKPENVSPATDAYFGRRTRMREGWRRKMRGRPARQ